MRRNYSRPAQASPPDDLSEFALRAYRRMILADLSLKEKNHIAESVAETAQIINPGVWARAQKRENEFQNELKLMRERGHLLMDYPDLQQLAEDCQQFTPINVRDSKVSDEQKKVFDFVQSHPVTQSLVDDESLHALVTLYLGAPAILQTVEAWWQFPSDDEVVNTQKWHRDSDDFAFVKLFAYLTDVDEDASPHLFLPGTHDPARLPHLFSAPEEFLPLINGSKHAFTASSTFKKFGYQGDTIMRLGSAGTAFLEDTRGFHKAHAPSTKPRLMFCMVWCIGAGRSIR